MGVSNLNRRRRLRIRRLTMKWNCNMKDLMLAMIPAMKHHLLLRLGPEGVVVGNSGIYNRIFPMLILLLFFQPSDRAGCGSLL
jgi:hypothetical protein